MTASSATDALLGIDLGTSSVKVVLLDQQGSLIAQAEAEYGVSRPLPGWAESAPHDWWNATVTAVRTVVAAAPQARPAGIGLSGQMHGVVPTRADGSPVRNAILWADARAHDELDIYRQLPSADAPSPGEPAQPGNGRADPRVARPSRARERGGDALGPATEGLAPAPAHR